MYMSRRVILIEGVEEEAASEEGEEEGMSRVRIVGFCHKGPFLLTNQDASTLPSIHSSYVQGHIARVCPDPRTTNGNRVSRCPSSNLESMSSQSRPNLLMDSGTTHHLTSDLDNLSIHTEYHCPEEVTLGNGSNLPILYIGKGSFSISGKLYALENLLLIPTATQNLFSINSFTNSNQVTIEFFPNYFVIKDLATRAVLHNGPNDGGFYSLRILKSVSSPTLYVASLGVWHAYLAHVSYPTVHRTLPSSTFTWSTCCSSSLCPTWAISKSH
ncbi:putative lysM domain receptor-like kinase 4-like [Capsicum annuum]|uniref:Retrovirus-related Pol polyprotein from transposon TNT 1-94-like beta-barrel domain-containing protein n=1 Tax=Capsicum annuum TaxID=4072 RepID=A0A2G2ZGA7_CAPAN|nr:putative lysM domain receptor-like kinase 4-like [Capsicum annuum]PHT80954.1 hypothetical protein T459_13969 [Capsicum annuum]